MKTDPDVDARPYPQVYPHVLLASASPRRAALMTQVGIPYDAVPSGVDEELPSDRPPEEGVALVAADKARGVLGSGRHPPPHTSDHTSHRRAAHAAVIGADTVVVLGDDALGKPTDAADAARMLARLSGRTHRVATGVSIVWTDGSDEAESWSTVTEVTFRDVSESEIVRYVASGRPMDKAGAYGIQEDAAAFVTRIDGCYFNVVGLPIAELCERLLRHKQSRG